MIIDCHGHYTTSPPAQQAFRDAQLGGAENPTPPTIGDDEIRDSIEANQLAELRRRGIDFMIFSPRAAGMEHHVDDQPIATAWARFSNDLIHRVTQLFPATFAGAAQLPQTPSGDLTSAIHELRRCVEELGFVGALVNPDPSGGHWTGRPMTDRFWYPLYETLVELDVPAMVHVSSSCNPNAHTLGAHYLNADTSVFMQLVEGDLFRDFPTLRLVIPHGGGAVPYHWGRFRGLAARFGRPELPDHVMRNVFFDTCVYHQPGIDLLTRVIEVNNIVYASEMIGAVRGNDPETGFPWDDTKRFVENADLTDEARTKIFETNPLKVYPRLAAHVGAVA